MECRLNNYKIATNLIWGHHVCVHGLLTIFVVNHITSNLQWDEHYTVKTHLFGPHLSGLFIYMDTCFGPNYDYILRKWLIYLDIQLSRQSTWELRCPDKWGFTVLGFSRLHQKGLQAQTNLLYCVPKLLIVTLIYSMYKPFECRQYYMTLTYYVYKPFECHQYYVTLTYSV